MNKVYSCVFLSALGNRLLGYSFCACSDSLVMRFSQAHITDCIVSNLNVGQRLICGSNREKHGVE